MLGVSAAAKRLERARRGLSPADLSRSQTTRSRRFTTERATQAADAQQELDAGTTEITTPAFAPPLARAALSAHRERLLLWWHKKQGSMEEQGSQARPPTGGSYRDRTQRNAGDENESTSTNGRQSTQLISSTPESKKNRDLQELNEQKITK